MERSTVARPSPDVAWESIVARLTLNLEAACKGGMAYRTITPFPAEALSGRSCKLSAGTGGSPGGKEAVAQKTRHCTPS